MKRTPNILKGTILCLFGLIILVPIVLAVMGGFKTVGQLNADPIGWPDPFLAENYINIFIESNFFKYLVNSVIIMIATVVVDIVAAGMAGFALSKFRVRSYITTSCWDFFSP